MISFAPQFISIYRSSRDRAAELFRPDEEIKTSEWAERYRYLNPDSTPSPGRWRNDYLPWLRPILDAYDDNPWCDGWALMKPTQVAGTEIAVTLVGKLVHRAPGPILFLCSTLQQARKFAIERFRYMITSTEILQSRFRLGKKNGETILLKPFAGGVLAIAGSGSPGQMISNPMRYVFLDEEDILKDFPGMGSAREIAEKRTSEYGTRVRSGIFSWAHPTERMRGVARTFYDKSDAREWMLECPHCAELLIPHWNHVEIPDRNIEKAAWRCHVCGDPITDQQRWRATWHGQFVSTIKAEEARRRRFVGMHLSKLCHPRVTIRQLAAEFLDCNSESQLQVFWNMTMGYPHTPSAYVITSEAIMAKVAKGGLKNRRACPLNTRFITLGVDVQKGREDVVLYSSVIAWTENGNAVVLEFGTLQGWDALHALITTWESKVGDTDRAMRIRAAGIDYGWKTRAVYDFCRVPHGGVACVPVKFEPQVKQDNPTVPWAGKNPYHPELGAQTRLRLCREYWIDRVVGRLSPLSDPEVGGSIVLPVGISPVVVSHLKAAHKRERVDQHGYTVIEWAKDKDERDDFLMAAVYAEVVAVACGLDRHHEPTTTKRRREDDDDRPGYIRGRG